MANLVLKNNSSTTSTELTMEVKNKSTWKLINNNGTFIINSTNDLVTIDNTGKVNINKGHLYLNGAAGTSTGNTTQIVFRQNTNGTITEHIAISSKDDAFIINPTSSTTASQIVLHLGANKTSELPSSLKIAKNLTVTEDITASGKFAVSATNKGYYLVDSTEYAYPGIFDNGSNLWIGSTKTKAKHHTGSTYISSGHNGTSGNESIYISIPNAANDDGTNYKVFHEGFLNVGKTTTGILKIENGGTNASTRRGAAHNLLFLGENIVPTTAEDTGEFWSSQGFGVSYTNEDITTATSARPYSYMHIMNFARNGYNLINQIGFCAGSGLMVIRGGKKNEATMGSWKGVVTTTTIGTATGSATVPIYVNSSGNIAACSTYAGGTAVTLNGTSKSKKTASFYAPTGGGTAGYILKAGGDNTAPTWIQKVPVANGGTGKTTGIDAANYFMNSLETENSTPVDADYYISQYVGGGTTTTTYHRRPMSALWLYVKGKMAVSNGGPTLAWGTTSTVGTVAGVDLKVKMPANPNTDAKVLQSRSTATTYRALLSHQTDTSYGTDPGSATAGVHYNEQVAMCPSTGQLRATSFRAEEGNISARSTSTTSRQVYAINTKGAIGVLVNSTGSMGLYDQTNDKFLVYRNVSDTTDLYIGPSYLYTNGVRPKTTNEWSCGNADYVWYGVSSRRFYLYDGTNADNYGKCIISEQGTTSTQGYASLYLGNNKAAKTAGGAYGRVVFYSSGTGSATIRATFNTDTETTHILPTTGGTLVNTSGATFSGDIGVDKNSTAETYVKCINNNGSVALCADTNRGVYDITQDKWMVYSKKGESQVRIPGGLIVSYGSSYPSGPVAGQVFFKTS